MSDALLVFVEAVVALAIAIALIARRPAPATLRTPTFAAILALLGIGTAIRIAFVRPSLIHADMLGPGFVDAYLAFPELVDFRATYGKFGFFAVGALTSLFGRDTAAVFDAMQLVGVADVLLLAGLAYRLAGTMRAALFVVAMAMTSPVLMRVAASEDMHNFALLPALLGLILIDHYATSRKLASLFGATVALSLLAHSRQTFYLIPPCAFLLLLARSGTRELKNPWFWLSGLTVLAVLIDRVMETAGRESGALPKILEVIVNPALLAPVFANHPVFDVVRFGALPVLTLASLFWASRAGRVPQALLVAFVINFVATYTCGFSSPGVEFAQRMPVVALASLLAAMFAAHLVETRVDPAKQTRVTLLSAAFLFALPVALPGWQSVRSITTDYREYLEVESMIHDLPPSFTLVNLPSPDILQGYSRYAALLRRSGKRVRVVAPSALTSAQEPLIFLEGVECWTYTFRELIGVRDGVSGREVDERTLLRRRGLHFERSLFGREPAPIRPVPRMREECARLLPGATPIGRGRVIVNPDDDPPFLYYASPRVPVRFYRLRRPG